MQELERRVRTCRLLEKMSKKPEFAIKMKLDSQQKNELKLKEDSNG